LRRGQGDLRLRRQSRSAAERIRRARGARIRRAPWATCLAILALVAQLLAPAVHRMAPGNVAEVAADLKAAFGDGVVLCIEVEDGKGAPAPARDCDDACPLCQLHSGAHALILPTLASLPMRIEAGAQPLALAPAPVSLRPTLTAFAQPRAPPLEA
jgi:hypothetical protein